MCRRGRERKAVGRAGQQDAEDLVTGFLRGKTRSKLCGYVGAEAPTS